MDIAVLLNTVPRVVWQTPIKAGVRKNREEENEIMLKIAFRILALLVFLAGALAFTNHRATGREETRIVPAPFEVTYRHYREGEEDKAKIWVSKVAASGRWKLEYDRTDTAFASEKPLKGTYSSKYWENFSSHKFCETHGEFTGEKVDILGYKAYVFRASAGDVTIERWFVPEIGGVPLKKRIQFTGEKAEITEAINIVYREVSEDEIN